MKGPFDHMFGNTPFDLNHDGHIDSNEAAFIYDTFYKEKDDGGSCVDFDDDSDSGEGWYPTKEELKKHNDDMQRLRNEVQAEKQNLILITIGVVVAIGLLVGNNIVGALILFGLFMLGSMFDFWR